MAFESVRAQIALALAGPDSLEEPLLEPEAVADFYAHRGHWPAWSERDGTHPRAQQLRVALAGAARHGLRPDAYHSTELARRLEAGAEPSSGGLAQLDLLASDAFLHLARHLARGAVDPARLHRGYERGEPAPDPVAALEAALASDSLELTLAGLAPPHPEYAHLLLSLEQLRAAEPPVADQVERVRGNLERWRWLPRELGERHLRVNAAEFRLRAFEGGASRLEQRVVVGCGGWETPPTHGAITHLVLNPAWDVPRSIAVREMLPAAQRDPDYFTRKGVQLFAKDESGELREVDPGQVDWGTITPDRFPFRLRQPAGPQNPLGRIKFAFPNPYGIWLHGTPGRAAFEHPMRNLSHGCVRVEDEIALALFTLAPDPTWTRPRLLEALRLETEHRVALPAPLPVHVLYLTASADERGELALGPDPYGWDRALLAALPPGPDLPADAGEAAGPGLRRARAASGPAPGSRVRPWSAAAPACRRRPSSAHGRAPAPAWRPWW